MFAVRYVVRTGLLERIRDVCDPVLGLTWDDEQLAGELAATGVEVVRIPDPRVEPPVLGLLEQQALHFQRRLRSPSTKIDRARNRRDWPMGRRARRGVRELAARARSLLPGDEGRVDRALHDALGAATNRDENVDLLRRSGIDAIVSVTPFVTQERVLLWAAESLGLPSLASILSFDNITTRPPLPITFDRYLVWNRHNRDRDPPVLPGRHPRSGRDRRGGAVRLLHAGTLLCRTRRPGGRRSAWRRTALIKPVRADGAHRPARDPARRPARRGDPWRHPRGPPHRARRHPLDSSGRWDRFADVAEVVLDDPGAIGDLGAAARPGQPR
ncbi:MAG: hypothetical protein R2701_03395 [Acidimicrobiales bacterium]